MLKKILESIDGLDPAIAAEYKQGPDGKFHLELDSDDAEPLRRAKEHEVGLRQIAERDLAAAKTALAAAEAKVAELQNAQSQDVQALRADHERTIAAAKADAAKERAGLEGVIRRIFVNDVANRIAGDIAIDEGAAELLATALTPRLSVEIINNEPITRVLGPDGLPTNASPDDLKKEYLQNAKYAGILKGNGASGGGASGAHKGGGASKKLSEMGDAERTKLARENPAEFQRLVREAAESAD